MYKNIGRNTLSVDPLGIPKGLALWQGEEGKEGFREKGKPLL